MPRPGPQRPAVSVRLSRQGIDHIDARAMDEKLITGRGVPNRSEMVRLMLAYASAYMPKGWRP